MRILRVDFSSTIGFGHLRRVENFIKDGVIICKECNEKYTKFPIIKIKSEEEFFKKVEELRPKEVIVDNYSFTYEDEKRFKKIFPNIKLICFDDTYNEHYCDEIINVNLGANREKYPKNIKVTILKKPLVNESFKKLKRKRYKKEGIFVSLGATDVKGVLLKVLNNLKSLNENIMLYTTSANSNLKKLKRFCKINRWCKLYVDKDVALGMAKAKFGIITPSTLAFEALYMNMPFIAIEIADNQKEIAKYLKKRRIKVLKIKEIRKICEYISSNN